MSIKNELDVIGQTWIPQNASKVRQAIHDILIKTYDTASENGNANMEVEIARGTHPNLRSRLEEVDNKQKQTTSQLAQKANKTELNAVSSQVDNLVAHAGDTDNNSEVLDIRVDAFGTLILSLLIFPSKKSKSDVYNYVDYNIFTKFMQNIFHMCQKKPKTCGLLLFHVYYTHVANESKHTNYKK